jgi:hypothetical protein
MTNHTVLLPPSGLLSEYEFDILLEHGYVPERCPCYEDPEPSQDQLEADYHEYVRSLEEKHDDTTV